MKIRCISCALLVLCSFVLCAQDLPLTHIYQLNFSDGEGGELKAEKLLLFTADNPDGYNNQPALIGNELYFTRREKGDDNTEIYACIPDQKIKYRVTRTIQDEYSPTPEPDGNHFSCVRVERNGDQLLWSYPIDRSVGGRPLYSQFRSVGYHAWRKAGEIALYIVGDPGNQLVYYREEDGVKEVITRNPGRSFHWNKRGELYYIDQFGNNTRYLKKFMPESGRSEIMVSMPAGVSDFNIGARGELIHGKEGALYIFMPGRDLVWRKLIDLSEYGIRNISRIVAPFEDRWYLVDRK